MIYAACFSCRTISLNLYNRLLKQCNLNSVFYYFLCHQHWLNWSQSYACALNCVLSFIIRQAEMVMDRLEDASLRQGSFTHGSGPKWSDECSAWSPWDTDWYASLVIQYLGIRISKCESKACHGNVTHCRTGTLQYALFNWVHREISQKMLFSVYIVGQTARQ